MLAPPLQALRNTVNSQFAFVYPEAGTLAAGVAQGQVKEKDARLWASYHGVGDEAFSAMIDIANVGPGIAEAFNLWRRGKINEAGFRRAAQRVGLEDEWIKALVLVKDNLLSFAAVAEAVQQGHLPNPDVLPSVSPAVTPAQGAVQAVAPDQQPPTTVPLTQIDLDPITIAAGLGYGLDELRVQANLAGLPPPGEALLAMWNRSIIDEDSVDAGIREGHIKTKWAGAYKRLRWAVLSGQEYAEARLRDWVTQEEMYAGGALTGHTTDQMDLFYKNRGRTATPRQVWLAIARKVVAPDYPDEPANGRLTSEHDHELAIRRSNIRPEYAPMLYDIRFNYPPLFQLNRLVDAGAISPDTAASWAEKNLYAPEVVTAMHEYWSGGTAAKPAVSTASAVSGAARAIGRAYTGVNITKPKLEQDLAALGENVADYGPQIAAWDAQRQAKLQGLSNTQIRNAYRKAALTEADALALLEAHGMAAEEAQAYLAGSLSGLTDEALRAGYRDGAFGLPEVTTILQARGMTYEQAVAYLTA